MARRNSRLPAMLAKRGAPPPPPSEGSSSALKGEEGAGEEEESKRDILAEVGQAIGELQRKQRVCLAQRDMLEYHRAKSQLTSLLLWRSHLLRDAELAAQQMADARAAALGVNSSLAVATVDESHVGLKSEMSYGGGSPYGGGGGLLAASTLGRVGGGAADADDEEAAQAAAQAEVRRIKQMAREHILKLIESRHELEESWTVPKRESDGTLMLETNTTVPQLHNAHKVLQAKRLEGTALPETVSQQYAEEAAAGLRAQIAKDLATDPVCLYMSLDATIFQVREPTQIFFSLWNETEKFLTEEFAVHLTAQGMPENQRLIGKLRTLFTDLDRNKLAQTTYIVCRVYRVGKLTYEADAGKKGGMLGISLSGAGGDNVAGYRRPFGVGVLNLTDLGIQHVTTGQEFQAPENMTIYQTRTGKDSLFGTLHEYIAAGQDQEYEPVPISKGVALSIAVVDGTSITAQREEFLAKIPSSELREKIADAPLTRRYRMNAVPDPREQRNELYVTLASTEVSQDRKTAPKNVQIEVRCLTQLGQRLNCLMRGTGKQVEPSDSYRSTVLYHTNSPVLNDTFKVVLPDDAGVLESAHLLFLMNHCSNNKDPKSFGFAFLPLTDATRNGAVLRDGEHRLGVYSLLGNMENSATFAPEYLTLADNMRMRTFRSIGITQVPEYLMLTTSLCSHERSQDPSLHQLLQWRSLSNSQLANALQSCLRMPNFELVKYARAILEAIYDIFDSKPEMAEPAFDLMVFVFDFFSRDGFRQFRSLLDAYMDEVFQSSTLYVNILSRLANAFNWARPGASPEEIAAADQGKSKQLITSLATIVGVIRTSHALDLDACAQEGGRRPRASDNEIKTALGSLMARVTRIMIMQEPAWNNKIVKGKLLKSYYSLFDGIQFVFDRPERAQLAADFMAAAQQSSNTADKLALARNLVTCDIFLDPQARHLLADVITNVLAEHLQRTPDERARSVAILLHIVDITQQGQGGQFNQQDVQDYLMKLLHPLLTSIALDLAGASSLAQLAGKSRSRFRSMSSPMPDGTGGMLPGMGGDGPPPPPPPHGGTKQTRGSVATGGNNHGDAPSGQDGAAALCCVMRQLSEEDFIELTQDASDGGATLVHDLLSCLHGLMRVSAFPNSWLVMNMVLYKTVYQSMQWTLHLLQGGLASEFGRTRPALGGSKRMGMPPTAAMANGGGVDGGILSDGEGSLASEHANNRDLWVLFFRLGVELMEEKALDLAKSTESKVLFLQEHYGDIRLEMITVVQDAWTLLGDRKHYLIEALVPSILNLVNCTAQPASNAAKRFFIDLLRSNFVTDGDFRTVSKKTVDAIDAIVREQNSGDDAAAAGGHDANQTASRSPLEAFFTEELTSTFRRDATLNCPEALTLADEIRELFTLLGDLMQYATNSRFEEERCFAYRKLMDFLLKIGRIESYGKYAHDWSSELAAQELNVEAGYVVLQYANLLNWSQDEIDPPHVPPTEVHWVAPISADRKAALFEKAMSLFRAGQHYEGCVKYLEQLCRHFQFDVFNYKQLGLAHTQMADLFKTIVGADRFFPPTFRVGYYGMTYPAAFRNKEFVYRGYPLESILDFSARVKSKHETRAETPLQTLSPKVVPDREHFNATDVRYIQISKVIPATDGEMEPNCDILGVWNSIRELPPYVRKYRENNEVSVFYFNRPFRQKKEKSENEFLDLWVERTYIRTEEAFPTTRRRLEVVTRHTAILNPIENAVLSMREKNEELREKIATMLSVPDRSADQSITMALNGTVDAAVNGGVLGNYETFITGEFRSRNPEIARDVDAHPWKRKCTQEFRDLLAEQLDILERAVPVHSRKCIEAMVPLDEVMQALFVKMRRDTIDLLSRADV